MLIFIDETFRKYTDDKGNEIKFGALCGVGIPISSYAKIANQVYKYKLGCMGKDYADNAEIKGKDLLSRRIFKDREKYPEQRRKNIDLVSAILSTLNTNKLPIFGCVCFDQKALQFKCDSEKILATTFKSFCERVNMYMKREYKDKKAIMVFDSRDNGTNERNSKAVTNYLVKTKPGNNMRSSVLEIPLFAISQANNIGLQLADLITTIIGMHVEQRREITDLYNELHKRFYTWKDNYGRKMSTLRWLDPQNLTKKE